MQLKLKMTVAAAIAAVAGVAAAQEVVKIGHVAPVSGAQAHYGKDNENGARMAIEELIAEAVRFRRSAAALKLPESATQTNTSIPFRRSEANMHGPH